MNIDRARSITGWLGDSFYKGLVDTAACLHVDNPPDLALVLYAESGLHHDAKFRDPSRPWTDGKGYPTAVGLNQITYVRAKAMGMSEADRLALLELSEEEQLPVVEKSFCSTGFHGTYTNAAQVYLSNFAPAFLPYSNDLDRPIYSEAMDAELAAKGHAPTFRPNRILDMNHDGAITMGDIAAWLERRSHETAWDAHLTRLRAVMANPGAVARLGGGSLSHELTTAAVAIGLTSALLIGLSIYASHG